MTVEWIGVVVLHYYLLHRFTRNRSKLYSAEEGFSFGQDISSCWRCLAGVIVGGAYLPAPDHGLFELHLPGAGRR